MDELNELTEAEEIKLYMAATGSSRLSAELMVSIRRGELESDWVLLSDRDGQQDG